MSFFDAKIMTDREIIDRIHKIDARLKEKEENNTLLRYHPHAKQSAFHKCQKRNRWVFGGNRSGKTECGAVEAVWLARGIHPYRKNRKSVDGWIVSVSRDVQREVAQRKILHYLNPDWIVDISMNSGRSDSPDGGVIDCITIKNVFGGFGRLWFKSSEMGRAKFQGASVDFVWFDEEPPEDIYIECLMRVADTKGDVFGTMTPLKGRTFVYDRIYLNSRHDNEVWYEFMDWSDNPHLDTEEMNRLSESLSAEELNSRRYGRFGESYGLVYSEFDENFNVIQPFEVPHEWYDKISIDPGLKNPLSCHFYATDGENVYVIAEHYEAGKDAAYHCKAIKKIAERLQWPKDGNGNYRALIDSAADQKTLAAPKSVSELFFDNGITVNPKVNKNVFAGICRVKQLLKGADGGRLYVFASCENFIREMKGYRWSDGDSPVKKDDHAMDELRYYVMSRTHYEKPRAEKSEIRIDKQRLLRRIKGRRLN